MFEGRAVDAGEDTERTLRRVEVRFGATFWGVRLRDGGLILRVEREREVAQIRVKDGTAFDPWRSGLELARAGSAARPTGWIRQRGGSWYYGARFLRSANRYDLAAANRFSFTGFRVARTLD